MCDDVFLGYVYGSHSFIFSKSVIVQNNKCKTIF